ncbi:MAG: glucuronate isomerase [Microbacterium sp.]
MITTSESAWTLHPDRALPSDPTQRDIARRLYAQARDLPIVSMHGHVEAEAILRDEPFGDPAELFVIPDHYLVRMLVSQGLTHEDLGVRPLDVPDGPVRDHRDVWRTFCENWRLFRGTPTRYWLEHELVEIFGVTRRPSAETADALYDELSDTLARDDFRIRALFDRFGIEVLATTDPAWSTLDAHRALAEEGWGERVIPTFRPDPLLHLGRPGWRADLDRLAAAADTEIGSYRDFLQALRAQRARFIASGARATDHGHLSADTTPLDAGTAADLFARAIGGEELGPDEAAAFSGHMLFEMAGMSAEDGLVMQLHPGSLRDYRTDIARRFGHDKGYDIPVAAEYTRALRPLLDAFGGSRDFRMILFTLDETVFSRELAPLAGAFPSVRLGAPWWFLDSPDGMRRFREAATETAGFANTSGFVDDTRAFASIPARHDLARRIDAGYLAKLVAEHRLDEDEAVETIVDLAYRLPLESYARRDERG